VDGDTISVQLQNYDSRIGNITVRLADVDSPEMNAPGGLESKNYAFQVLNGSFVNLDLDDVTGKDRYCRWVAVVFLQTQDGTLVNFNRMLVDSGHASIWDFKNNEFDPAAWWNVAYPQPPAKLMLQATSILSHVLMVRLLAINHPENITILAASGPRK
jgi:micrococcal nuclease